MCRALKMKIFLRGMLKAFDSRNTKSLYGRKRSFSPTMMYGNQKTYAERLSEDWIALGNDFKKMDIHTIQTTVHKGPLPDSYTFEQYDKVVPGAANRILTKFEQQGRSSIGYGTETS